MKKTALKSSRVLKTKRLEKFDKSWSIKTLSNGLRIVHVPLTEDNRFYIGATIATGSRFEKKNESGISHLLEHMMFRGSKKFPTFKELATAFEWLGGTWNAGTGHEHTEYYYSGSLQFADDAIELFAEFFLNPRFQDLAVEKKIVHREIEGELNEFGLSTDLDYQMQILMRPNSSLSSPIMGTKESVSKIKVAQLKDYRLRHYRPDQIVVCAVGGEAEDQIIEKLTKQFEGMEKQRVRKRAITGRAAATKGPRVKLIRNPDNEYQVQLSFRCDGEWSKKSLHYELIARVLADGFCSRLGHRIREQLGMVYDIDAELTMFSDTGTIDIFASVELNDVKKFLKEVCKILGKLKERGPTLKELERAKRRSLVDLELLPDDPDMIGFKLSWALLCGKQTSLVKNLEKVHSVSKAEIQKICGELFSASKIGLILLGPENKALEKECLDILKNSF